MHAFSAVAKLPVSTAMPSLSLCVCVCTYEWDVIHGVDDNSLVLLCVLCDTSEAGLHHMVAIEELLLS